MTKKMKVFYLVKEYEYHVVKRMLFEQEELLAICDPEIYTKEEIFTKKGAILILSLAYIRDHELIKQLTANFDHIEYLDVLAYSRLEPYRAIKQIERVLAKMNNEKNDSSLFASFYHK